MAVWQYTSRYRPLFSLMGVSAVVGGKGEEAFQVYTTVLIIIFFSIIFVTLVLCCVLYGNCHVIVVLHTAVHVARYLNL